MSDDALSALWMSDRTGSKEGVMGAMNDVLQEDRVAREKDRWVRAGGVLAVALLCPVLLWAAAYGKTPLVRGAYALMAVGTAVLVSAEWRFLAWGRQAMPGPDDARSQLQKSAFLLGRQATLVRMAPLWCAPIFIGAGLIGAWLYTNVGHASGYGLWLLTSAGWLACLAGGVSKSAALDARRVRMERVLTDLLSQ